MRCGTCGLEHDWSELEPSYTHPDAFLLVPEAERAQRTISGSDDCRIRDTADSSRRYFFRALIPVAVYGETEPCCWGVWVEVDLPTFTEVRQLWDAPDQHCHAPFPEVLANSIRGYPETLGLEGTLQLTGPTTRPHFVPRSTSTHPLAVAQRTGVHIERVLEWLHNH